MSDAHLSPTSYIVLGLLVETGQATPYELKQMADNAVGDFWSLPRSQLYAEPARLAQAGYLTEDQEPDGRRRKRYTLTERGADAFKRWTESPTDDYTELRDLAFLKLFFGADPTAMAAAQLTVLQPLLRTYEAMLGAMSSDASAGPRQTLEAGIDHVKTSILSWQRIAGEARESTLRGTSPSAPGRPPGRTSRRV